MPFCEEHITVPLTPAQRAAFKTGLIPDDDHPELAKIFEYPRVVCISGAQVAGVCPGVYFRDGRLLDLGLGWSQGYKSLKTKIIQKGGSVKNVTIGGKPEKIAGKYLCLNALYGSEFYHAIFDVAYQIFNFETICGASLGSLDGVVVPYGFSARAYGRDIIRTLLPESIRVVEAPGGESSAVLEFDDLIVFSWSRARLKEFRAYMLERFDIPACENPGLMTFCTRGKMSTNSNARVLLQNEQVISAFRDGGFEIVDLADMSLREQFAYISNNKVLAGVHGAALSHQLFLGKSGAVIEILGPKHVNNIYYHTACGLGLSYFPVFDARLDVEAAFSDRFRDSEIDIDISALVCQLDWISKNFGSSQF